jgi:uncharacterized protein
MLRGQRLAAAIAAVALVLGGALGAFILSDGDGTSRVQTAFAQDRYDDRGISVHGIGQISVTPDIARIVLGVEVEGEDLEALREDADTRMNDVIDALLRMGFKEGDIRTIMYDIQVIQQPEQPIRPMDEPVEEPAVEEDPAEDDAEYSSDDAVSSDETDAAGMQPDEVVQRYRIVQLVQVRVSDIDVAGTVIETALDAGANRVAGISFEVEDQQAAVEQAREQAVEEALAKAEHLADLTGVTLGSPLKIEEFSPSGPVMPFEEMAMAMDDADGMAAPRIAPGEQTISVSVYITYAID